jgi:predicted ATP-grasp superfamily ATP-dependent carboligase
MRVIVTDADYKNSLSAIRNLGQHGVSVVAASPRRVAQGFLSKYADSHFTYPPPSDEERFIEAVLREVSARQVDLVLPVGDATTRALSRHKARVSAAVALPVADWPAMEIASNKKLALEFAHSLSIPVPRQFATVDSVKCFPVVVKGSVGSGRVRYVHDREDLKRRVRGDVVIQELIRGDGYGFFALFDHGRERAVFMHRRLREYPVTGGASTAAESVHDPTLQELGLKLLRALNWHGVAMVEFKRDVRDHQFKLMEINAKFWGSLDLALAAGVEFPWLALQLGLGRLDTSDIGYRSGVRFRWVFDDFMHALAQPGDFSAFIRDFRDPSVRSDLSWDDPKPQVLGAAKTAGIILRRVVTRTLRRPHGALEMSGGHRVGVGGGQVRLGAPWGPSDRHRN